MMNANPKPEQLRMVIPTEQLQKRVREMARQISFDYQGKTIHALGLLENGFVFMADLVRVLEVPVICQFIKPKYRREPENAAAGFMEIFFSHELAIAGQHVLLIEGLVHSGVTTEFLMNDLRGRGAASVKLATLLDRQAARRVQLQPDYFGFLVDEAYLMGYGLGSPEQTHRNLPYVAATS
jgi:hypoxanthine phosphoribosyltransferase